MDFLQFSVCENILFELRRRRRRCSYRGLANAHFYYLSILFTRAWHENCNFRGGLRV